MDFELNCSPILNLTEIVSKFFNLNKISDVQFIVDGKSIYAHSFVLMARSKIFEEQMEHTLLEKKIIPIVDYKYANFLEFIRFIYTDACTINDDNGLELLKLAVKYKVVKLENQVINSLATFDWLLQLFEHCVIDKYQIPFNYQLILAAVNYGEYLKNVNFVKLHPDALEELLKFDQIEENVTEQQIFNAVARWIDTYCKTHHISLSEGRNKFDNLIKQIRFPTMTQEELKDCVKKYPQLLNNSDCASIANQILFGGGGDKNVWLSRARVEYVAPSEWIVFKIGETIFETLFKVSRPTILHGLAIGVEMKRNLIEIEISNSNQSEKLIFTQNSSAHWPRQLISLGDSIHLKPNNEYAVRIRYLELIDPTMKVTCRKETTDAVIHDPDNSVKIIKASRNMIEMFFKSPTE